MAKKPQLFLGKLDHFCVDQNCVFHSGWKAISSHVTGHLQPCYWQAKPAIFSLEFGPSLGIFVPIKWLFFHRKSPAALLATKTDRFWQKSDHPQALCSHQKRYFKPNHEVFVPNLKQSSTTALAQERLILNICKVMNIYVGNWVYPAHLWLVSCYRGEQ